MGFARLRLLRMPRGEVGVMDDAGTNRIDGHVETYREALWART